MNRAARPLFDSGTRQRTHRYVQNGYSNITELKKNDRVGLNRRPESI